MIGIFDSGSGGLSVLKEIRRLMPRVDVIYFADLANFPYGEKTLPELDRLTFVATKKLLTRGATQIINACNTVSASLTLGHVGLLGANRDDIIEMIGPALADIAAHAPSKVAITATRATIRSGAYQRGLDVLGIAHEELPSPDLVEAIELGADDDTLLHITNGIVDAALAHSCDALLLGCTHFPLARAAFERSINLRGTTMALIDPAEAVGCEAARRFDASGEGTTRFIMSKDSEAFRRRATELLGPQFDVVVEKGV